MLTHSMSDSYDHLFHWSSRKWVITIIIIIVIIIIFFTDWVIIIITLALKVKKHIISTCNGNFDNKFFIFLFVFVICYCWQSIQYSQSWAHGLIQIQTRVAPELHNWLMIQKSQVFSIYNLQNKQINYFNRKYFSFFIAKTESSLINSTGHKKRLILFFCF